MLTDTFSPQECVEASYNSLLFVIGSDLEQCHFISFFLAFTHLGVPLVSQARTVCRVYGKHPQPRHLLTTMSF